MIVTKAHILDDIKRTADANGGQPLGRQRFYAETGIKETDWSGRYSVRWSEALRDAGYIGRTNAVGRRERELSIQLPERAIVVHSIKTDDPAGIEAYWHVRFKDKRKNGEWFELSASEVSAFKRRRFM